MICPLYTGAACQCTDNRMIEERWRDSIEEEEKGKVDHMSFPSPYERRLSENQLFDSVFDEAMILGPRLLGDVVSAMLFYRISGRR